MNKILFGLSLIAYVLLIIKIWQDNTWNEGEAMSWTFTARVTSEIEDPAIINLADAEAAIMADLGQFGQVEITELRSNEDEETEDDQN